MKLKKIKTLKSRIITTFDLLKTFGFSIAVPYFLKTVIFRTDNIIGKRLHVNLYENIKEQVNNRYSYIIDKYINLQASDNINKVEKKIWMIWWQGIDENTPITVKKNINRVKQLHPCWDINIITKNNYKKFVEIPKHMEKHIDENDFSFTHISDYLRIVLLEKYGGIYLDCNFFLLEPLDFLTDYSFYTIKHGLYSQWHVSKGKWLTGFMAAGKNNVLYSFLKDMYDSYFADYSFVPLYFFIDAVIALGYENIKSVRNEIESVPYNNSQYNFINFSGNEAFDNRVWETIVSDTFAFNVNSKNFFKKMIDGKITYFGYIYKNYQE
jgi:hypothetical protein